MANYLALVNKALDESGSEFDHLTLGTWSSAEAGRRLYPRMKSYVAEAWKAIQMSRNEWEFNTAELSVTVFPRIKFVMGAAVDPSVISGAQMIGQESNTVIEVIKYELDRLSDPWEDGGAFGQIEFRVVGEGQSITSGEGFIPVDPAIDVAFTYEEKGSYDFLEDRPGLREPQWSTFVAGRGAYYPVPILYVPWENWVYKTYNFVGNNQSVPAYISQDPSGRLVFYPQPLAPFKLNFWYDEEPQALVEPEDIPTKLPGEYHDWIMWEALTYLARYDKNPDLFDAAETRATFYKRRAERNLMPLVSWQGSKFNRGG